jgi:Type II secretion system (T2SS), protein M subtype b
MLTRLLNAPLHLQRAFALLILGVAAAMMSTIAVAALLHFRSLGTELAERRESAGRLVRIATMKEAVANERPGTDNPAAALFVEGDSVTIARANLQGRLSAMAQSNGVVVDSAGNLPDTEVGGVAMIGLRLNVSGTHDAIHKTMLEIETDMPPLFVREMNLRLSRDETGDRPPDLAMQLRVYGAFRQAKSASGASADAEAQQ